jgi:O-antigen ligase
MRSRVEILKQPLVLLAALLVFCLPLSKSAVSVLITIIAATLAFRAALQPGFRRTAGKELLQPLTVPFLLMLGISLIGVLYTERMSDGLAVANKVLTLPLVYLAVTLVLQTAPSEEKKLRNGDAVLFAFLAGVLVLDCIGFLTYLGIVGRKAYVLPLAPLHVHHIWLSNLNALGLYAAASFFLPGSGPVRSRGKAFLVTYCAAATVAIVMSQSRTAWLGVLATAAVLAFLFLQRKKTLAIAGVVVLAGGLLAYQFSPLVKDRVTAARTDISIYASGDTTKETSMGDRFLMWEAALKMFRSNPIGGVGTGDYYATIVSSVRSGSLPERFLKYNQPHNLFLFTLATTGLVGFLALLYLFVRIFRHALPERIAPGIRQQYAFVALATAVHYLIAGLFDSFFNIFVLRYAFAVIMAVTIRHRPENPLITKH